MEDDANNVEEPESPAAPAGQTPKAPPAWLAKLFGPDVDVKRMLIVTLLCVAGVVYFFWEDVRDIIKPPKIIKQTVSAGLSDARNDITIKAGALDITFTPAGGSIKHLTWTNANDGYVETLVSQKGGVPNQALVVNLPGHENAADALFTLASRTDGGGTTTLIFKSGDLGKGVRMTKTFKIRSDKPLIELTVHITGIPAGDAINEKGYALRISNAVGVPDDLSKDDPLISVRAKKNVDHHPVRRVSGAREWPNEDERKRAGGQSGEEIPAIEWVATASKYFALIVRPVRPIKDATMIFTRTADCAAAVDLVIEPAEPTTMMTNTFSIYAGPKDYGVLKELSNSSAPPSRLQDSIDYWGLGHEATGLLQMVRDKIGGNYGLAIIVATLLLRILMWPVTGINLKSMVKLKLANAKLTDVDAREPPKTEEDAKEWLEELLPLKKAGAEPPAERVHARTEWLRDQLAADTPPEELQQLIDDKAARVAWLKPMRAEWLKGARVWEKVQSRATIGAFLPMVILLPILLVLYYALNAGYEFYRQPLALWITDISARDPYFLLPVLMGLAMMAQFRAMSGDPKKEKSWIIMPAAFTIIFAFFSAGLVLFWTVDTLAGWGQVALIRRGKKPEEPTPDETAEPDEADEAAEADQG